MKRVLYILMILLFALAAGCSKGGKDIGGLGSLTMEDTEPAGSIGTLGQPTAAPTQSVPDENPPAETVPSVPSVPAEPAPAETVPPVPAETAPPVPAEPTPAPVEAGVLQVEEYSCPYFTVTKPVGWQVHVQPFTRNDGSKQLFVAIQDPADPNNMIFYVRVLEPYFISAETKRTFLSYGVDSIFEWSPLLDSLSAKSVLMQWGSSYTMMEIEGTLKMMPFQNYRVEEVVKEYDGGTIGDAVKTGVLAVVTIPGAAEPYGLYLENVLNPNWIPNTNLIYYYGTNNLGFVADPVLVNKSLAVLNACKNSFVFNTGYGIAAKEGSAVIDVQGVRMEG